MTREADGVRSLVEMADTLVLASPLMLISPEGCGVPNLV
jgi:hypothetical protein